LLERRSLRQVSRLDRDLDIAGDRPIHEEASLAEMKERCAIRPRGNRSGRLPANYICKSYIRSDLDRKAAHFRLAQGLPAEGPARPSSCGLRNRNTTMSAATPVREGTEGMAPAAMVERDLRLDLFRGLALWLIFLDHIPSNIVSWITIRNYGFSDATEIFVFISGYTAAFVYGRAMHERGVVVATARILKRAWQVYVAHIFLFAVYMAEISYISTSFDNPLYGEEAGIFDFLRQPDVALVQALLLKFKPANMDILPLYITLLAAFPPFVWLLLRWPNAALAASLS